MNLTIPRNHNSHFKSHITILLTPNRAIRNNLIQFYQSGITISELISC
ncbi:hypothetical protein DS830_06125 [Bombilactobacillus bombi]|nr:hypothetical protein DS830_06125 [Bombilactobacillus bombi]